MHRRDFFRNLVKHAVSAVDTRTPETLQHGKKSYIYQSDKRHPNHLVVTAPSPFIQKAQTCFLDDFGCVSPAEAHGLKCEKWLSGMCQLFAKTAHFYFLCDIKNIPQNQSLFHAGCLLLKPADIPHLADLELKVPVLITFTGVEDGVDTAHMELPKLPAGSDIFVSFNPLVDNGPAVKRIKDFFGQFQRA